jgi:hypothetical protein
MKNQAFELASIDGLDDDQLKEMANLFAEKCQKAAQQTIRDAAVAGNALNVMKSRIPHGQWVGWLGANFDYSRQTAVAYMTLAANVKRFTFEPTSIREALRMIAEQPADVAESAIVPRAERKTGRVEVEKVGHTVGQADKPRPEKDDDLNPAPRTNTKHSAATVKAKEADRPAPQVVTPEFVEEETGPNDAVESYLQVVSPVQIVRDTLTRISDDALRLKEVRRIRKELDKFDPPDIGAPSIEAVHEWASSEGIHDFDAEKFFNHYALAGWKYGKAKTPIKDWRRAAVNAYGGGKGWAVDGANRLPF